MHDRPTAAELTEAVAQFLSAELAPTLADPRMRFRVLIAANLMSMVTRELQAGDEALWAEWRQLATLLGETGEPPTHADELRETVAHMSQALCVRIRAGEADAGPWRAAVLAYTLASVQEKLNIANPKFLARVTQE
ncbi:MAG: DUF6285 domain-containing protein [Chloroflexaceae bacterium]|jgi:hypothetical protein|nr:DUF6285 domain-containing protein [Chloroflexaceae bacterium]